MARRAIALALIAAAGFTVSVGLGASASVPPSEPPTVPAVNTTIPSDCPIPKAPRATFVGVLVAADRRTARFEVRQLRGGNLDGYTADGLVDVDFGDDVRFLDIDVEYIVAAALDDEANRLFSKVRDPEPLFGGNQVIGIEERNLDCPDLEDAVRTLTIDGRSVESGVLAPLADDSRGLIRAVLLPFAWVFGGLVASAVIANGVRALASRSRRRQAARAASARARKSATAKSRPSA
ncbi:MAG: hypothetical protein RIS33_1130 [Actinomycetota bacterium]